MANNTLDTKILSLITNIKHHNQEMAEDTMKLTTKK